MKSVINKGLGVFCFILAMNLAAQKDTVVIEMDGATVEVAPSGEDVQELMEIIRQGTRESQRIVQEHRQRMDAVNKQLQSGAIQREEAERQRAQIAQEMDAQLQALEEEMERAGEAMGKKTEIRLEKQIEREVEESLSQSFESQWEAEAREFESKRGDEGEDWAFQDRDDEEDAVEWEWDEDWDWDQKKKNQKQTNFIFDFHMGFNTLLDEDGNLLEGAARLDAWRSNIYEIGFNGKTRLGSESSKAYLKYGLSFSWHDWTLRGGNVIYKDSTGGGQIQFLKADENVRHSEWRTAYMNVPLMFQLDLSERGMDNGFTLGVGGYGGLRLYTIREIQFNDFADDRVKDKNYNNYYMNNWRYGLLAQIGFNSFKITAQYDLNPLFRTQNGPQELGDLRNLNLTLGWSF